MNYQCSFCGKAKETKTIFTTEDTPQEFQICKDCSKIEIPYLDWEKLSDLSGLKHSE